LFKLIKTDFKQGFEYFGQNQKRGQCLALGVNFTRDLQLDLS